MNTSSTNENEQVVTTKSKFYPTFFLGLFFGVFGAHRFYTGKIKSGVVQLLTFGGLGIWWFIDMVMILIGKFKDKNGVTMPNVSPKMTWGIFAIAIIIGIASNGQIDGGASSRGGSSSGYGSSHKTAKQLIVDYAKSHYGSGADVTVDGPMYGNSYQVLVRTRIVGGQYDGGIDDATYTVTVDTSSQEIKSWELVSHN
jgi:TM2 domain-containing membrane protein YozV